ncbi:hypothetical protein V8E53_008284 [Lactarius tabidus]
MSNLALIVHESSRRSAKQSRGAEDSPSTPTPCHCKPAPATEDATPWEDVPMRMDVPDTPHQRVSRVNVVAFGAPPEDYISRQDVLQWAMPLNSLSTFGGELDPSDMVVGGLSLERVNLKGGVHSSIWYRTERKKGLTLTSRKELVHRSLKGRSFTWLSSLAAAWPPPLTCRIEEGCSFLWFFELDMACNEGAQLELLARDIAAKKYVGYAFQVLNKSMEPLSHKWFLCLVRRSGSPLASSEWVTDTLKGEGESAKFVVKDTVWQGLRCCICWQSIGKNPHCKLAQIKIN